MSAPATSYKPTASRTSDDTLATFITAELEGTLKQVPGVGDVNERILRDNGITTSHQLLGKFLTFKGEGVAMDVLCDSFYQWLKSIGVNSSRASIVKGCAEKLNTWVPGFYDDSAWES